MCRPMAAWSIRRRRSGASPALTASSTCSMPANPLARCRSTSPRSAATCCPRPGGNICAGRAAPDSSMCGAPCSTSSSRRFSICRLRPGSKPDRYEMRPDARRFENWERNVAAQLGLGAAVDYALGLGLVDIYARVETLADDLRRRLAQIPGVSVRDRGRQRCGIVTFTVEGKPARDIVAALRQRRMNCHTSGTEFDAARCPGAPVARSRARVRALLQHRRGGDALRGCGRRTDKARKLLAQIQEDARKARR